MDTQTATQTGTCCRHCVFYDQRLEHYCELGKLEKLVKRGGVLLHKKNNMGEWVEIDGRICRFFRNRKWENLHENENLKEIVRKESVLHVGVLVYIDDGVIENVPELLCWTVDSLNNLQLKPKEVVFVVKSEKLGFMQSIKFVNDNVKIDIPFRVEIITEQADKNRVMELCIPKFDSQYIAFVNAGYVLSQDFILILDKFINDKCGRVIMIRSQNINGDGLIIQKNVAKLYKPTKDSYSIEKHTEEVCKNQGCEYLVKTIEEIRN